MSGSSSALLWRCDSPILQPETPWEEGSTLRPISVLPEGDGRNRLYYLVWNRQSLDRNVLCVAYTSDGLTYERPDLGEGHNIVMRPAGHSMDWGCFFPNQIIRDQGEEDDAQRYKMVYWDRPAHTSPPGFCFAVSKDGLKWRKMNAYPAITAGNDGCCLITAPEGGPVPWLKAKYHLYQQTWMFDPGLPSERDNLKNMRRRISVYASRGLNGKWVGPIQVLAPDEKDPRDLQYYWLPPFHLKTGYGGFLGCHHTLDQTMTVHYVTSPDGWSWEHQYDRQAILPVGEAGRFDCGMCFSICSPMRCGDKVYMLYGGRAKLHDQTLAYPDQPCPVPKSGMGLAELDPEVFDIP